MSTVSARAEQRPGDVAGHLPRHLRTAGLWERTDPACARAAEELMGHPRRVGVLPSSVRAPGVGLEVLAGRSAVER
ncbi:hypothetical protein ACIRON_18685 [Nocardioides sp. NPDC101246]|uniref:hypothetical protein n=1 Tax=Nocardioides sp. NPDC101246 TaxID=3364336 RepID=UPI00380210F0